MAWRKGCMAPQARQDRTHPAIRQERAVQFYDPDRKFVRLASYLAFDFSAMRVNKDIVDAIAKWGDMTSADARNYLSAGHGPYVVVVDDNDERVSKPVSDFPDAIYLDASLVNSFETNRELSRLSTGNGKRIYAVGLAIIEMIIQGHLQYYRLQYQLQTDAAKVASIQLSFEQDLYGGIRPTSG
jgi:hypothetical protein